MEMSNDEIIKKYEANPTEKHINILADLNGCKLYEIKRILGHAGLIEPPKEPKKRGPKPKAQSQINQKQEPILQDETEKESIKSESARVEMRAEVIPEVATPIPKYLIPEKIRELCEARLDEINVEIMALCNEIDRRSDERKEIKSFLRGEFKNAQDGVYGEVPHFTT